MRVSKVKKVIRKTKTTEDKTLKELSNINKTLVEMRELLDNIWRERTPGS